METITDYSYGVIPLRKEAQEWKVFLINQIPRQGSLFWTFPKGHPEEGETHEETALRELEEETGIIPKPLDIQTTFSQKYTFKHENQMINKQVLYYVGYTDSENYTVQDDEVKEGGWFSFLEARALLTHKIAKGLIDEIESYLENNNTV